MRARCANFLMAILGIVGLGEDETPVLTVNKLLDATTELPTEKKGGATLEVTSQQSAIVRCGIIGMQKH